MTSTDTTDEVVHLCRAGRRCCRTWRDADGARWSAITEHPDTLCPGCVSAVERAVARLWGHHLALHFGAEASTTGSGVKVGGTRASPVPINVHADALGSELSDTAVHAAEVVTDLQHLPGDTPSPGPRRLPWALDVLEGSVPLLLTAPVHPVREWRDGVDGTVEGWADGPSIALRLLTIHERAADLLGITTKRWSLPAPCPGCERAALGRVDGTDVIDCAFCRRTFTETTYRQLCLVQAHVHRPAS